MSAGIDEDMMLAGVDVVGRMGARQIETGFLHDDVPSDQAAWWASALWNGTKVHVEDHTGPDAAIDALARRLLDGGTCTHCAGTVRVGPVSRRDRRHGPVCMWVRTGPRWDRTCTVAEGDRIIGPPARHGDVPRLPQ